ncbi:hypothetical protein [Burkholderia stagnalis]
MSNPRVGNVSLTPASAPSASSTLAPTGSNQRPQGSSAMPTGHATQGPLAALRRTGSMQHVHQLGTEWGVTSAVRVSIQAGNARPQVDRTAAFCNYGKNYGGVLEHSDHSTVGYVEDGATPSDPDADRQARRDRSPERIRVGGQFQRTADTNISKGDAEVYAAHAGVQLGQAMMKNVTGEGPWDVQVEFHGNDGPCGNTEQEGCKGRLAKTSATLEKDFQRLAPAGSKFTATSVYRNFKETQRGAGDVPTAYGYRGDKPNAMYGEPGEEYKVMTHTVRATGKPPAGNAAAANTQAGGTVAGNERTSGAAAPNVQASSAPTTGTPAGGTKPVFSYANAAAAGSTPTSGTPAGTTKPVFSYANAAAANKQG